MDTTVSRQNPTIDAWIKEYKTVTHNTYEDCHKCGWPHSPVLLCGSGSTFGVVRLGETNYYIDSSNVEFMLQFVDKIASGFHWKNEVFFDVADSFVIVTRVEAYNNCPHKKTWKIPLREWQSITEFVQRQI